MSDYKIQANPTIAGILFNVNGDSTDEVKKHLAELAASGPEMFESMAALKAAALAAAVFADNTANAPSATPTPVPAASAGPPNSPSCPHGAMKDLQGVTNAKGEAYKFRYYCAADRNDPTKCKAGKN